MATTVFALELIRTSQGWVEPAHPLATNDIPDDELAELHGSGKVVYAEHDSPLAARAHEIRRSGDKSSAVARMRDAMLTLSPESVEPAPDAPIVAEPEPVVAVEEPTTEPVIETPAVEPSTEQH